MSNTVKVYDLEGEMFEMSHANAADAIAHLGWSKNPPKSEKKAAKVEEKATEPVSEVAKEEVEEASSEEEEEVYESEAPKRGRPKKS